MVKRYAINKETGVFNPEPVSKGKGKSGQIKAASWCGKKITFTDLNNKTYKLNLNSAIKFLRSVDKGSNLKKGFLCFKGSSKSEVTKAFEKYKKNVEKNLAVTTPPKVVSPTVVSTPDNEVPKNQVKDDLSTAIGNGATETEAAVPSNTAVSGELEIEGIPKKFFTDVAEVMRSRYQSPILAKVIEKFASTFPTNPFELLVYQYLTQFKNLAKYVPRVGAFSGIHEKNVRANEEILKNKGLSNLSETEKGAWILAKSTMTDENLWKNYNERKGLNPLQLLSECALYSHYFQNNPNVVFSDMVGNRFLNENPKDKILLCAPYNVDMKKMELEFYLHAYLTIQNFATSQVRPKAIIIPLGFAHPSHSSHATVLVVEPAADKDRKANIFMINTHGNSLSWFLEEEKAALSVAKKVYSDPETVAWRNEKKLWATAACTHNALDIIRTVVDQMSQGKTLKELVLTPSTAEKDKASSIEHGNDLKKFLDSIHHSSAS